MKLTISTLLLLGTTVAAHAQVPAEQTPAAAVPAAPPSVLAVPFVQIPLPAPPQPKIQPSGLDEIVRARFSLSIGFEDLGAGWRRIEWYNAQYFTRGEAVFINETEYLVAYRAASVSNVRDLTERAYIAYLTRGVNLLRPGTRLPITLLQMSEVQRVVTRGETGLKSFDADDYKFDVPLPTSEAFNQNLSVLFLRKIGEALTAYSQASLEVLPPLENAAEARQNLEPFAENGAIFLQPGPRVPFRFNSVLSGRKRAHLRGKGYFVVAYEGTPAADGSRAVLRLNGTVLRADEKTWRKLKEASRIE